MGVKRNLDAAGLADPVKITEDEAALYDRQIRLWGMECQKHLREAKILIVGLNGVGAEVVKNLTLTGVKKIVILDDKEITPADSTAQFFVSAHDPSVRAQRAQASESAIKDLNPNVEISVLHGDVLNLPESVYKDFHAIVATDCAVDSLIKLDNICREHSVQFYCADTWGFYGYCFLDLQEHNFKHASSIQTKEGKKESVTLEASRSYCPLGPTLLKKVGDGLKKRVSKVFILFHVVNHFREMFNRYPSPESRENDVEELKKLRTIVCEKLGCDESKITDEMLSCVFGELSPICATIGGVLANQIIKGLTKNGVPVHNYFLFDGHESVGTDTLYK